ncbi:MAG: crossover junction endodeoxyribonuclease RuvC [Acidobacteria bacterium]|nr:crossover junction endodeoxyribonuclease RuvC [Acidobacteriota bacterium]
MTRILGVDPGSAATGWALVRASGRSLELEASGVIRTGPGERAGRLARLEREFSDVVASLSPDQAAVESGFSGKHPRAGLMLAESRGVLLAVLGRYDIPTRSFSPAEVKTAVVGYGRAEKEQVVFMVTRLLNLVKPPARDAADAMAVALTGLRVPPPSPNDPRNAG